MHYFYTFLFIFFLFRYPMAVWCHLKSIIYWWAVDALQETKPRMQLCEIWWRALLAVKELVWLQRSACVQAKALTVNDKLHSFTILAASLTFYQILKTVNLRACKAIFSNFHDMRKLQEQVKKAFSLQKLFLTFTVWVNCSSDLKNFVTSRPSASNFKSFSWSLEQFFLTVSQNNFGMYQNTIY